MLLVPVILYYLGTRGLCDQDNTVPLAPHNMCNISKLVPVVHVSYPIKCKDRTTGCPTLIG